LYSPHGILSIRLFVAPSRHAEERTENVVAGQGQISRMNLSFAPEKNCGSDGLGIVPPNLLGNTVKELEGPDHAFEDRFGPLEGQRQNERVIGIGPRRHQERNELTSVGKIDVNVAEVSFKPLTREMPQRNECLLFSPTMFEQIALHLGVAAVVTVLVAKAPVQLSGGVPLLGRGGLVVSKDRR
jgi:hypothetical protein